MFGMIFCFGFGVDGWFDINFGFVFGFSFGGFVLDVSGGCFGVGWGVSRFDMGGGGFWFWVVGGNEGGGYEGVEEREEFYFGDDIRVVDGLSEIESLIGVNK